MGINNTEPEEYTHTKERRRRCPHNSKRDEARRDAAKSKL
jgi:hypothetical protein